jgi:prevent-host-death family protein
MNPNLIGAIAETAIAAEATRLGFDVYRPVAEGGRADCLIEANGRLVRVQCKTAVRRGEVIVIRAMTCRRTSDGYVRGGYTRDEIDVVVAYCAEFKRCFAVPITLFGRSATFQLRLSPPRNGQKAGLHFAEDYPLGAIAQLEERRLGRAEVEGSSPSSSTLERHDRTPTVVGAHEFRNRFGWYMERAAAGEQILVTRRGKPQLRLSAVAPALNLAA